MNISGISRSTLLGRTLRLPLKLIPATAVVPILQGRLRGKAWIVGSSNHGCWLGSYEYHKRKLFERMVRTGDVVYDVGAHVGFYTLLASVLVGKKGTVVAFEPLKRNVRRLREHLRLNDVENVDVIEAAVCESKGSAFFAESTSSSMGRLDESGNLEVETVVLDELVAQGRIPPPSCMKIDVEGAELMVLKGARSILANAKPSVFLATHGRAVHRDCLHLLRSIGYALTPIRGYDLDTTTEVIARWEQTL